VRVKILSGVCEYCDVEFSRVSNGPKDKFRFCNVVCSNRFIANSRKKERFCSQCGSERKPGNVDICRDCRKQNKASFIDNLMLQELRDAYSISQYHGKIRGLARSIFKGKLECVACGYNLHVDVCHIRPVADFPMSATLAEVNAVDNLTTFCPNHHWEFDNGHLEWPTGR
jgi:hypothetical protein